MTTVGWVDVACGDRTRGGTLPIASSHRHSAFLSPWALLWSPIVVEVHAQNGEEQLGGRGVCEMMHHRSDGPRGIGAGFFSISSGGIRRPRWPACPSPHERMIADNFQTVAQSLALKNAHRLPGQENPAGGLTGQKCDTVPLAFLMEGGFFLSGNPSKFPNG